MSCVMLYNDKKRYLCTNYHKKTESLMKKYLVKADISGIQNFIFDTTSEQAGKNLKGRSFYVYALTHLIETYLSNHFNIEEIVYNGGGNLLLYLTGEESELEKRIKEIQQEFLKEQLYPYITYIEAGNDDFASHNKTVNEKMVRSKLQKQFSCQPFSWKNDHMDCEQLVKKIRNAAGFSIKKGNDATGISKVGLSVVFTKAGEKCKKTFTNNLLNKIPTKKNKPVDFDTIAKNVANRNADEKLGALKMDIDNLGKLFIDKKKEDYTTLSKAIEEFFEQTLYTEILKQHIDNGDIYPVFAGGDDCFLIGGWDVIFNTAICIQEKFNAFQENIRKELIEKQNDDITLSAGLIVVHPKYPVIRLAEEVEQALGTAKANGKNKITVFGEPLTWHEYKESKDMAYQLMRLIVENGESRALLQRIKSSDIGYRSLQETAVKSNAIRIPNVHRLKYYLRNAKSEESRNELGRIFQKYSDALVNDFMQVQKRKDTTALTNPARFPVAARWAELLIKNDN